MLVFANKTKADIIRESEFKELLGNKFINILSDEKTEGFPHGFITEEFLRALIKDFNKIFYVCGPPPMMDIIVPMLRKMGISENSLIQEAM